MKEWIVFGISFVFLFNVFSIPSDNFSVATTDGLQMDFNENGDIVGIIVDGRNIASGAYQPFRIRDFTPDYEIKNLIYNGGFEIDANNDGIADGWEAYAIQGNANISLDAVNVYSGNYSLKMYAPSAEKQNKMAYLSSLLNIDGNEEYCLSLFAMNDFGFLDWWTISMNVYCIFYDENGKEISRENLDIHGTLATWKQFSKIFVSPARATKARIAIIFNGPKNNAPPGASASTAWFDNVCLYKMPQKTKMRAASGTLREAQNELVYEGNLGGLDFTATYKSKGEYIQIEGEIEGNGEEKAMDVYFLLPINAIGWKWWDDIRNSREIREGVYEMVVNADESSYLPFSPYPMAAITNHNVGLSIAIPLSKPRIFRIFYDASLNKFGISFNFGLSPLTKFHSVNFTIYIYKCDAEWGFRSSLARYYHFFPEYFNESIDERFMNCSGEFADFGIRAIQGHFENENQAKLIAEYNAKNVFVAEYTMPIQFEPKSLQSIYEPSPNYEEFLNLIDYYARNGSYFIKMKAKAAKNSTMSDTNGDVILAEILRGPSWAPDVWLARFPLNVDPDLPRYSTAKMTMQLIQLAFQNAHKYGGVINGIENDNFIKKCRYIDMNESRFKYADFPLVYNPNNFKPGIHGVASMIKYLRSLREWLDENEPGTKISGNCIEMGVSTFGFPYLSALPFEMGSLTGWNFNDIELNYRRSMAYHRYLAAHQCNKMYDEHGNIIMPYVYEYINESLFYGIYPLMKDDFFENCNYERARSIYKKAIPILDELYLAGWEPITYAHTTNDIWIERFGSGSTIYFTVRNNDSMAKNYDVVIDTEKLGIGKEVNIMEMLSLARISYEYENGKIIIHDVIKGKETKVFKVSRASMIAVEIKKPKEGWLYIFNRAFMRIGNTIIVGKITIEADVYSSGEVDRTEFYIDDVLKYNDTMPPYQWLWKGTALGKHKIKVIAYDNEGNKAEDEMNVTIFSL